MKEHDSSRTAGVTGDIPRPLHGQGAQRDRVLADLVRVARRARHIHMPASARVHLEQLLAQLVPEDGGSNVQELAKMNEIGTPCQLDVPLTRRQLELLALRALGLRAREMAHLLSLSESTVHTHLRDACSRLGTSGGWGRAVHKARALGLLDEYMREYEWYLSNSTQS